MIQTPSDLAHFKYLTQWKPLVGDIIIWHGWFTHWYGVVKSIDANDNELHIIKMGLPVLLLTLDPGEYEGNTVKIPIHKVRQSNGGKYAAIRSVGSNTVWYI